MVMDVTPSPQCVGREFVRQYYTLLNEAPQFLHRFYSHNSSFNHGGDEKLGEDFLPVIGQNEIHKKIMSLNFRDCHAKIRYVDSQATIGTAVVVQVTGELSNNQEPLRRFMQTFVLAPQTPNKYYVHNDIFRYQDEVFNDSDEEEELADQEQGMASPASPKQASPEEVDQSAMIENSHPQNNMNFYQQQQAPDQQRHQMPRADDDVTEPPMTNGHDHRDEAVSPTPPITPTPQPEPEITRPAASEPAVTVEPDVTAVAENQREFDKQDEPLAPIEDKPKPCSWANVLNSGSGSPATAPVVNQTPQSGLNNHHATAEHSLPANNTSDKPTNRPPHMRNNRPGGALLTDQRGYGDSSLSGGSKPSRQDEGSGGEERRAERPKYPDSQQVFVGNLPATISDFELKSFFKTHGAVMEVRINRSSQNMKAPFGFVVFEDEACAQKVLANKSLEYKGQRLNVEEKKPRSDGRNQNSTRSGGRRDGPRHMRSGGNRGGFGGPPREHSGSRTAEHGRYNNLNKSNQSRR